MLRANQRVVTRRGLVWRETGVQARSSMAPEEMGGGASEEDERASESDVAMTQIATIGGSSCRAFSKNSTK